MRGRLRALGSPIRRNAFKLLDDLGAMGLGYPNQRLPLFSRATHFDRVSRSFGLVASGRVREHLERHRISRNRAQQALESVRRKRNGLLHRNRFIQAKIHREEKMPNSSAIAFIVC